MREKEEVAKVLQEESSALQKTIEDLVKIFNAPPKQLNVEKKAEHYFVIG